MRKKPSGKAPADIANRNRANDDAISVLGELDGHRVCTVVAVERDMMRQQKATGSAGEDSIDRFSSWRSIGCP